MSKAHWVALATGARIGGKTIRRLLEQFDSLEEILSATPDQLTKVPGIGPHTAAAITHLNIPAVEADLARLTEQGIQVIAWEDMQDYPVNLLRHAEDAPPVLFVRGELSPLDARAVAIVGTRWPTLAAKSFAGGLAYELARRGWTIVSGLALGIDAAAHEGALDAHGRTLAVLGSGLNRLYPPENVSLAGEVMKSGAVLSEVHPDAPVSPQRLMARNRITSGLSRAVIVIEANTDGGSVSTARRAWQQGRSVFAVAGGDTGCVSLIAEGAEAIAPGEIDWDALSERLAQVPVNP